MITKTAYWRGGIIYQIYPRSFYDGNNDGVGDLIGILSHLDYVASLGIDAIWISPFFTSPMKDFGYDISDYQSIDPIFGQLSDFDAVVKKAHSLDIKIFIDQVISHTSDQHKWFQESRENRSNPKANWYVWHDPRPDGSPPNNWLSVFGGSAWQWESRRSQYYLKNFLISQPDLNYYNPEMRAAILDSVEFWLKRGVDGFRMDACNFYYHDAQLRDNPQSNISPGNIENPLQLQKCIYNISRPETVDFLEYELRPLADKYGAALLGEIGAGKEGLPLMRDYTQPNRLHFAYSFALLNISMNADVIRDTASEFERIAPDGWPCWSFCNHDSTRHVSKWMTAEENREAAAKVAISLLVTLRGSICIYQGEELGMTEANLPYEVLQDPVGVEFWPKNKGRDGCRTPIPWDASLDHAGFSRAEKTWLPIPPEHYALAVSEQESKQESVLNHYRRLFLWRKQHQALITGSVHFRKSPSEILIIERSLKNETIVGCFNLSDQERTIEIALQLCEDAPNHANYDGASLRLPPFGHCFGLDPAIKP